MREKLCDSLSPKPWRSRQAISAPDSSRELYTIIIRFDSNTKISDYLNKSQK